MDAPSSANRRLSQISGRGALVPLVPLVLTIGLALAGATLALTTLGGCQTSAATAAEAPSGVPVPAVRVLLVNNGTSATILGTKPPVLEGPGQASAVRLNLPDEAVAVSLSSTGWRIGDQTFGRGELTLTPTQDGSLAINGKKYRGRLRFVPRSGNAFDVVNDLDMESYLMGVLPKELPPTCNPTTYEAQAVVARTYAIFELKTAGPSRGHFDLYDDDKSQVYGGMDAETPKSQNAVRATRGQVVVHETPKGPRIFKAYFHSTSGGVTLGNDAAFNEPPIDALSAQDLGELGKASSRHNWDAFAVGKDELTRRLKLWGERRGHPVAKMAKLDKIVVAAANKHGRPTRYELIDAKGNHYSMIPEEIRWSVNTDRGSGPQLYSGWFRPINNATNIVFADGRGWGHGVGMCQWSAEAMANAGDNHLEIVTRSYPKTRVVRAY